MPTALRTTTTDLGDARVRVEVEVDPREVEREVQTAARTLGRDLRIPGFRAGKVPPPVVMQRVGREAVLDEAVRQAMPGWYEDAVADAGVAAVGDPKLDVASLPGRGDPLAFSFEVAVRPPARLGEYKGLEVGRREPSVDPAAVDAELDRLRDSVASLETVERPAQLGDFVVIDFVGSIDGEPFEGGEARGFTLELGSEQLIPGFEEQLVGAGAGDEREVRVSFPEDYQAEQLAGAEAAFATRVIEVKEKRLPELDDEFAAEAAGLDTLEELRADIEARLAAAERQQIDNEFREAVVDAVADRAELELPHDLLHAKAHEMWERTAHRLRHQGLEPERYLQFAGKTEEELVTESEPDAERALRRESVLAAVAEAESIEVSDDELLEALRASAAQPGRPAPTDKQMVRLLDRMKADGRDEELRQDIAMRKAVDLLVESARPIGMEQAAARDKLWTPDKDEAEAAGAAAERIWTPGSA